MIESVVSFLRLDFVHGMKTGTRGPLIQCWGKNREPSMTNSAHLELVSLTKRYGQSVAVGITDMAMVGEAMGKITYGDKGNMTRE